MSKIQIMLFIVPKVISIASNVAASMKKKSDGGKKITATERKAILDDATKEFRDLIDFQFFGDNPTKKDEDQGS